MSRKKYPRVADSNGQPRELTEEEKTELDSLVYKYGKKQGEKLFFEDFTETFAPSLTESKKNKLKEEELKLIKFYQKEENIHKQKSDSISRLFKKYNVPLSE